MDEKEKELVRETAGDPATVEVAEEPVSEVTAEGAGAPRADADQRPDGTEAGEGAKNERPSSEGEREEASSAGEPEEPPSVRRAEFEPLEGQKGAAVGENIELLLDVTVPVTVELGSTEMRLRELLAVGPGSVIKLDRRLGRPLDILVNDELVGRGDVVVVGEQFGVRVTELAKRDRAKEAGTEA